MIPLFTRREVIIPGYGYFYYSCFSGLGGFSCAGEIETPVCSG
jgi:hypothetical protein